MKTTDFLRRTRLLWVCAGVLALAGCNAEISDDGTPPPPPDEVPENIDEPIRDPIGPADLPAGRSLRRMTAAQFNASLTVATGQEWADYERFAAALGRADFAEIIEEGVAINVTFEKLVEDAARATCLAAIAVDVDEETTEPVLLRHVTVASRETAAYRQNLEYLLLRFVGATDFTPDDSRLTPWLTLLESPVVDGEGQPVRDDMGEPVEFTDNILQDRWTAVCVGLITHPDFVTY